MPNLSILLMCMMSSTLYPWHETAFDAMQGNTLYRSALAMTYKVTGIPGERLWHLTRTLYSRFRDSNSSNNYLKIPKIIHHIWLGSPLPESLVDYVASWHTIHGNEWEYVFWTDEQLAHFPMYNRNFYDATDNYGVKSDIARMEILYIYGGLYVDTDFECLQRFDELHYCCDFYVGLQPLDTGLLQLGSALIGCVPGHPIIEHSIKTVKNDWHRKGATAKTGPLHLTKSFIMRAGQEKRIDVALPPIYFYPLGCKEPAEAHYNQWRTLNAFAVHHWSKMWMPKEYRLVKFRDVDNQQSTLSWNS